MAYPTLYVPRPQAHVLQQVIKQYVNMPVLCVCSRSVLLQGLQEVHRLGRRKLSASPCAASHGACCRGLKT